MTTHIHTVSERRGGEERGRVQERGTERKRGRRKNREGQSTLRAKFGCCALHPDLQTSADIHKHMSDTPEARNRKREVEREREI